MVSVDEPSVLASISSRLKMFGAALGEADAAKPPVSWDDVTRAGAVVVFVRRPG